MLEKGPNGCEYLNSIFFSFFQKNVENNGEITPFLLAIEQIFTQAQKNRDMLNDVKQVKSKGNIQLDPFAISTLNAPQMDSILIARSFRFAFRRHC